MLDIYRYVISCIYVYQQKLIVMLWLFSHERKLRLSRPVMSASDLRRIFKANVTRDLTKDPTACRRLLGSMHQELSTEFLVPLTPPRNRDCHKGVKWNPQCYPYDQRRAEG